MRRPPMRFWALAILLILIAAQVHVWMEGGPVQSSGHACKVCISGAWAILSQDTGMDVKLLALRLEAEPARAFAKSQRVESSSPRAPPLA